jgi:tight adherence protein C
VIYLSSILVAVSFGLFAYWVAVVSDVQGGMLTRRLGELERISRASAKAAAGPRSHNPISALLVRIGDLLIGSNEQRVDLGLRLSQAGYRSANAVGVFWGARMVSTLSSAASGLFVGSITNVGPVAVIMITAWFTMLGWIAPGMFLSNRRKARSEDLQAALPDTLDLMVVCIDAGLGMNQAWMRVAEEIRSVSQAMADELSLTNLQIRAGVPREEALRNLGVRTDSPELRSLAAMLIQTDRFGTSVSQALRIQSETLRNRRRHRAEEAAAKTAIKLSFPLVLCIMPALFAVVLGGAMIEIMHAFAKFK